MTRSLRFQPGDICAFRRLRLFVVVTEVVTSVKPYRIERLRPNPRALTEVWVYDSELEKIVVTFGGLVVPLNKEK